MGGCSCFSSFDEFGRPQAPVLVGMVIISIAARQTASALRDILALVFAVGSSAGILLLLRSKAWRLNRDSARAQEDLLTCEKAPLPSVRQ